MALLAAIEGGADAVYIGGVSFNARINAKNFTPDELREGISLAHTYGVKVYIAANTLIYDREREDYLRAAEVAYLSGADALIVADLGMARELRRRIPIELHASTQLSGHNASAARKLEEAGFSRMVCAREMSREDIREFCRTSPIEAEVFVHGALCMSTSGQCLFSSIVGGRSGNRGECAQPCRLPYTVRGKQIYPLSLCDLSLARYITELSKMGVASFKIEGRMKSPEYVRDVTKIWRRLIDEGKNASAEDMAELAKIFSRGGFTDGYYTKNVNSSMLGIRSEKDKLKSAENASSTPFEKLTRKLSLHMSVVLKRGLPAELTAACGDKRVTAFGAVTENAINTPITRETVIEKLSKLGGTPYELAGIDVELDEGIILPISSLNSMRRQAVEQLNDFENEDRKEGDITPAPLLKLQNERKNFRSAVFYNSSAISTEAREFFDLVFVPLEEYENARGKADGVMLPEVIFDSQYDEMRDMLRAATEDGIRHILLCNIGHIELARSVAPNAVLHGDMRLNISNSSSAAVLEELGFEDLILSPELSLAQLRDIGGRTSAVVYGRLPLMLTEKCVARELGSCEDCRRGALKLVDRRGVSFPVRYRYGHRSVIFNSVPVYMADRADELSRNGIKMQHFIFSDESAKEVSNVIYAYRERTAPTTPVRRIK